MGPPGGDRTEGLGVRFLSPGTGHGMCQPWKGKEKRMLLPWLYLNQESASGSGVHFVPFLPASVG